MALKPTTVMKLAHFTRRFGRYRRPWAYRLSRIALKLLYPDRARAVGCRLVVPYDRGLINVDTASKIEYRMLFHGYHQPEIATLIRRIVKPGHVCMDLGANIGSDTLLMAFAAGPEGRVIGLEPHPQLAARLRENLQLNRLGNVTVVEAAISDSDGTAALYTFPDGSYNQGVSGLTPDADSAGQIPVRTVTGPALLKRLDLPACDLVKIDVQGYEMTALEQLADFIQRHRPHLIFEWHKACWQQCGRDIRDAIGLVSGWDYTLYYIKDDLTRPLPDTLPDTCDFLCVPQGREEED